MGMQCLLYYPYHLARFATSPAWLLQANKKAGVSLGWNKNGGVYTALDPQWEQVTQDLIA